MTGRYVDALRYSHGAVEVFRDSHGRRPRRVAVVGGGPAGLTAAIALIQAERERGSADDAWPPLPALALAIFEKRSEPARRQHVFLDFGRLRGEASSVESLNRIQPRLDSLLATHGMQAAPGAAVELRTLEQCLRQMLAEEAQAAEGRIAVRWESRPFRKSDLGGFDHVIGADGRRSAVRGMLMARIPRVALTQCALSVEFSYNCHLEWQAAERVHVLKAHRYEAWRPVLLYQLPRRREVPEYLEMDRSDHEAVRRRFCELSAQGHAPFTQPFDSADAFLELFAGSPEVQRSLRRLLETGVVDYDPHQPAVIAPVEQTLHRTPHLVSPASGKLGTPDLWLLGDAAVGLPVSKGCNLAYHMASAGRLAAALPAGEASAYEAFVFDAWHGEAWRDGLGRGPPTKPPPGCFGPRLAGRFTG